MFCACTSPETYLCERCVSKHIISSPSVQHMPWALEQLRYYKIPGYFDRLKGRKEAFPSVKEQTLTALGEIDKAIEEYSALVEKIIWDLIIHSKEVIEELKAKKGKLSTNIEAALEEVERTMKEDKPTLSSFYGSWFRDVTETNRTLQLCQVRIQASVTQPSDLVNVHCSLAKPPKPAKAGQKLASYPQRLSGVYKNQVFLYEIQSQKLSAHYLSLDFGYGGSYVEIDANTLLCLGAHPASDAVYQLELSSFQLISLPPLSTSREDAGIAKVKDLVYVFGGYNAAGESLRSCEKMQLSNKHWTQMNNMAYPRVGFTPCYFRSLLYLISSSVMSLGKVETFNQETEIFALFPVSLPSQVKLNLWSVAFIANGELCLMTWGQQMARLKIGSENEFRIYDIEKKAWSNQPPLVLDSLVLIPCEGNVWQFSLETYTFIR